LYLTTSRIEDNIDIIDNGQMFVISQEQSNDPNAVENEVMPANLQSDPISASEEQVNMEQEQVEEDITEITEEDL